MSAFSPVAIGRDFTDPFDIYQDREGNYAYLQILVPFRKQTADGTEQAISTSLPRFREGAEKGTLYYAMFMPFMVMDESIPFDTRVGADEECYTIAGPVYEGPYLLGINGPAKLFEAPAADEQEEEPSIA